MREQVGAGIEKQANADGLFISHSGACGRRFQRNKRPNLARQT